MALADRLTAQHPSSTRSSDEPQRVAIVTGAERGIGAGLVAAFRDLGYSVVGTSLSMPASDDSDFLGVTGDITQAETAQRVVERARDVFGRIDSLINNAGIYIGKAFTDYTLDDYAAITAVNLTGFFHITQRVIQQMVAQGSGHVVSISTSLVDHADSTRPSALASLTKGGLVAVTRSLAIEYASRGVRVNAVSLGVIKTPLVEPSSYASNAVVHPLGRMGEIADVVDGILYLERDWRRSRSRGRTRPRRAGRLAGHPIPLGRRNADPRGVPAPADSRDRNRCRVVRQPI